jgi:hypothetical protein
MEVKKESLKSVAPLLLLLKEEHQRLQAHRELAVHPPPTTCSATSQSSVSQMHKKRKSKHNRKKILSRDGCNTRTLQTAMMRPQMTALNHRVMYQKNVANRASLMKYQKYWRWDQLRQ